MSNLIKMKIQIRRDTQANWDLYGHLAPAPGEPCFVIDKNILKIGDGVTPFKDLEPINGVKIDISADNKSIILDDNTLKLMGYDQADIGAQPVKTEDGIEWIVPSTETVEGLQSTVAGLQSSVTNLQTNVTNLQTNVTEITQIIMPSVEGEGTLLDRVESLEKELHTIVHDFTDDEKINTMMELIEYVADHGKEAADMAAGINDLRELVGLTSVHDQIVGLVSESEQKARAIYEHVKYEIENTPVGTLVDYREKEIRVMVPASAQFTKQTVGAGGDANSYYCTFKTYVPNDDVVGYVEHLNGQVDREILTDFSTDKYGRRYQPTWLALATYNETTNTWSYYGKNSTTNKYIGYDYQIDWYDANGVVVASDKIRINLSNEACYNAIEPFYMNNFIKEVTVNGTLLDVVDGKVDVIVPEFKGSDEIEVGADGTLSIKSISFDKIAQADAQEIVLNGGGAAG